MKTIVMSFFLLLNSTMDAPVELNNRNRQINAILLKIEQNSIFLRVIEEIKRAENLSLTPYKCPAGHWTIGYGHALLPGERFSEITEKQAEQLLIKDFNKRLAYLPVNMQWNKRLAVAKFIFNTGIGYYNRSELKIKILAQEPIDDLIVRYCHYKKNGKYVKSNWLVEQRNFELEIYNYEPIHRT